jgi:hypothetical protein
MPAFDTGSYTLRACNGRALGDVPDNLQPTPRLLSLDEIDAVIAYLQARVIGRGPITHVECMLHYDNPPDCEDYN